MAMPRRTTTTLGAAAALMTAPALVEGKAMATCMDQFDCMDWTVDKSTECAALNGQCGETFKVCVTVHSYDPVTHPRCPEKSFSHYCPAADCSANRPPTFGAAAGGTFPFVQCQHAKPGEEVTFVFKDGQGCGSAIMGEQIKLCQGNVNAQLSCAPRGANDRSCTNTPGVQVLSQVGKECIWKVALPNSCPECITTTATDEPSTTDEDTTTDESTTTTDQTTTKKTTTSGQESMPGDTKSALADPFANVANAEVGSVISVGGMQAWAFAAAVAAGAVVTSALMSLNRRARAAALVTPQPAE
mmetsp:Transcript_34978/g.69452  ORF Transcript_34978/g.69452 Transcript_34978/m.69452 type:complete len:301 (-) Transcript_34978:251-1153(-)